MHDSLDYYESRPKAMTHYLANYGWHFNKAAYEFAMKHLPKKSTILTKEKVDLLLETYNIKLTNNQLYDYLYIANYCMAVYLGSSIQDEKALVQYIKDTLDADEKGSLFAQWYASMCRRGIPIEWTDML